MGITKKIDRVEQLLSDHRALLECICGVRDWTRAVSEWGMPRFGELGSRLAPFREALVLHFAEEESGKYSEIALRPTAHTMLRLNDQHQQILERLDKLIGSLRAPEPEFHSWQAAVEQVESVITEICDHEQHESGLLQSAQSETSTAKTGSA